MIQVPADFVESGCVVIAFRAITTKTLEPLPPYTQAHLNETGAEMQNWFNQKYVGKSLTPNDAAHAATIGQITADRIYSVLAQRSRFVKLGVFPNLVQVGPGPGQHPYYRVAPGITLPWWAETMLNGIGGLKFKSRCWYPLICLDHAGSVPPTIAQLHLDIDDEIKSLWSLAGLQTFEYKRDNSVEASSNFWLHQVRVPLPAQVAAGVPARDLNANDQSVYIDLSVKLDFSQSVIAAAFSWKGVTDIAALDATVIDLINLDDSNAAKDRAIAASAVAGTVTGGQPQTRANVTVDRETCAIPAVRYTKTELFALILNEVSVGSCWRLCLAASGKQTEDSAPPPHKRARTPNDDLPQQEAPAVPIEPAHSTAP